MYSVSQSLQRYEEFRNAAYQWRQGLSVPAMLTCALLVAVGTGVAAQVRIPVPGTPVPFTGQVFAVLMAGVLLGGRYGALSQCFYLAFGMAGLPVFAGLSGGGAVLMGVTGGYLLGFLPAALFTGFMADNFAVCRKAAGLVPVMLIGIAIIYTCGAFQYALFMRTSLIQTMAGAVLPFVAWDVVKAFGASLVAAALLPDKS